MDTDPLPYQVRPGAGSRYRQLPVIGPILDDLLAWLRRRGSCESSIRNLLVRAGRLCRWLQQRCGPALSGLSRSDLRAAYDHFRDQRIEVASASRVLALFLDERQLLRAEHGKPLSHAERYIQSFGAYLREVRGLTPSTASAHCRRIRAFLRFLEADGRPSAIRQLSPDQIDAFLCQAAKTNNRFSMQPIVASLRAFLRQLYAQGVSRQPLHQRIDTPRTYRLEQLPRAWPWEQVLALLRSIDCSTPHGLRDFTLLHLATSYG